MTTLRNGRKIPLERYKKAHNVARRSKTLQGANLDLQEIEPLTKNQLKAFESDKNMVLHGVAGTGKTFIACYFAFDDMIKGQYDKLVVIRSAVPTRDIGFLPGSEKEKASVYEEPYKDICVELFQRGDAYQILKTKALVHFMTTSFIRGITLRNATIIIDECQNMSFHELDSIITRVGEGCRVIFCGDFRQADLQKNGLRDFVRILKVTDMFFDVIDFEINDIVRSKFVKQYITAKEQLGL
jgi:phosphate starvation-inducible PhoH-like protein